MEEYMNTYGLVNKKTIYRFNAASQVEYAEIFQKSFPTNPIKGIKLCLLKAEEDHKLIAPMIIKEDKNSSDNIFIIDLTGEVIGNYYFAGLIVDNMKESELFLSDLKGGKISLGVINIDNTAYPNTIGNIVEQLTSICGASEHPVVYIFIGDESTVKRINDSMNEYFIKLRGEFIKKDGG